MPFQKNKPFVSPKLRDSARGMDCTVNIVGVCNYNPETVVLAHINTEGSVMGGKTSDLNGCWACYECHSHIDQHKLSNEDELFYTRRAMARTINKLFILGIIKI